MTEPRPSGDTRTVTVRVPIAIRTAVDGNSCFAPDGAEVTAAPVTRHVDNAMVKAIAWAFRWRDMLESGGYATIRRQSGRSPLPRKSTRPTLVETILNGRQPEPVPETCTGR
jgi:hypothetical protein